ncbi:MAG TPA: NAD(P)-dependent alcohol dehydrogenase [Polyangia bacterium]|nr:NAD(P)-dependent alcohol dehydrogenase [Polyangia bacterium]
MAFRAQAALAKGGALEPFSYEPQPLGPNDVEIAVSHCGLCHSDIHLVDDGWGRAIYPLVPGHEIVGTVAALGSAVGHLAAGQRVGVGWQRGACLECDLCLGGEENLCAQQQATCMGGHHGGVADRIRLDGRFVFPIPEALASADAAPLLCGGVTVYSPMRRFNVGPTSSVAVIGIGGLGHMALLMLRALGCEVTAFSTSPSKKDEALSMGAHDFACSTDAADVRKHFGRFNLILSTVHARLDWTTYLRTLRANGVFCLLGLPPGVIQVPPAPLVTGQRSITGSDIGGRKTIREMLAFAARHQIKPLVQRLPMAEANVALQRLRANQVRYRIVLEN